MAVGLALLTLVTFWGVQRCEFVNLDDYDYVVNNPHVNKGLNWSVVTWAAAHAYSCNWHPLTWLSHAFDCQLFGLRAGGHHVTNLLLHTLSSVVLFLALRRMTGALWRSAFVAALFAVHPLHVESVAWVSERKDVLSGLFLMLTLYSYARYAAPTLHRSDAQTLKRPWYILALCCFALGLMSKPMLVTLPFVLLLLDYWPLGRLGIKIQKSEIKSIFLEKLPFFLLALASCVITILAQRASQIALTSIPLHERWGNAALSCVAYLRQMFWPAGLSAFYPYPKVVPMGDAVFAALLLVAITWVVVAALKSQPFAIAGWLWFLGMLVPVIGLVQVGTQARADRYTYLPSIGIFVAITWGAAALFAAQRRYKLALAGCAALGGLGFVAHLQAGYWKNNNSLFRHAAEVVPDNYFAMTQVAMLELKDGQLDMAMPKLVRALELEPAYPIANQQMGVALLQKGKAAEAIQHFRIAEAQPELRFSTHIAMALAHLQLGDLKEATAYLDRAESEKPGEPDAALVRAALLLREGKPAAAEQVFRQLLAAHPDHRQAQVEFANLLLSQNRPADAEPLLAAAVRQQPESVALRSSLATALSMQGKLEPALQQMEGLRKLAPADPLVYFQSAEILSQARKAPEAVGCYEKSIELNPAFAGAMNNLAWILATHPDDAVRNGHRAVELAEKACELTKWEMPMLMGTLAAAYAEAGRFEDAIKTAGRARDKARALNDEATARRNEELIQLYRSGKPCREGVN